MTRAAAPAHVAAVDLGASSGRVMVAAVGPDILDLEPVSRFPNDAVPRADGLHWDIAALRRHVLDGLAAAAASTADRGGLAGVGIDTWAVDYGLLRDGMLLGDPFHYRDERRCVVGPERVHALIPQSELYARTGLQYLAFNTLYQLLADDLLPQADRLLLIPDLLGYWLTGRAVAERTNASTTGLLDVTTREWDRELMGRLGLPAGLFPELIDPGDLLGPVTAEIGTRIGAPGLRVTAVGSHDTASAVVGVPMQGSRSAYICLGTWGLVGVELDAPVVTAAAREANFTNEGGVDGTIRFLTNVMGTWLLSETLRTWGTADLTGLLEAAEEAGDQVPLIDVQDPRFLPPGDMPERIAAWCDERGIPTPATRPALIRTIVESLAAAYTAALEQAERLSGAAIDTVHVVGGGARNGLLCRAIATRSGRPVIAGPVESTALGNVLVQARAAGVVTGGLDALRDLIARTQRLERHDPR